MNVIKIKDFEDLKEVIDSGEIKTFAQAIKVKCYECSGYSVSEVSNCPNEKTCPLWAFRKGKRKKVEE